VASQDPNLAARIANSWATLLVRLSNELYGRSDDQTKFFGEQLTEAKAKLDKADQALIEFKTRSDQAVLAAQLGAKQKALQDYLELSESLDLLQQNLKDFQKQLAQRPADSPSDLGDDLAQIALQINVLSAKAESLPFLLQVPSTGGLSGKTVAEQATYMAELSRTVESKQAEVKKQAEGLPVEIKALQGKVQEATAESQSLTRERDLAESVYTTLAQKAKETQISAQTDSLGNVRIASMAVAPDRPVSRKLLINTALALMVGLVLSAAVVLVIEHLRATPKLARTSQPEHVSIGESRSLEPGQETVGS
jgi:uncharacterized protein involved in exopolysaccharide biosynthesis